MLDNEYLVPNNALYNLCLITLLITNHTTHLAFYERSIMLDFSIDDVIISSV